MNNIDTKKMITIDALIDCYKISLGNQGAADLISKTLAEVQMEGKTEFSLEEAKAICQFLKKKSGFIGIVAGILLTRLTS